MSLQLDSNMELTRTISHLAAANQQLATAHNLTIGHLHWLFNEFKKPQDNQVVSVEKRCKTRTLCSNCKNKENNAKTRRTIGKQSLSIKVANKRLRRLRKLPAFDISKDENEDITKLENSNSQDIENGLRREIEDLNTFKLESQSKNDRLINDLEEQRLVIERLRQDFEDSRRECEKKERRLEQVSEKLNKSESESARLHAELETFHCERISAQRLAKEEAEKSVVLRARLAEQDEERRKQLLALDEATQQIRALEMAIQASNQTNQTTETNAVINEAEATCTSASSVNEEFKKELMLKREARQRAIAAISSEMDRLRRDLESEKNAHSETTKLLESLRESQANSVAHSKTDDNDIFDKKTDKKTSERIEALRLADLLKISDEITSDLWLQLERTDDLRFQLENDPEEHRLRIGSLKRLAEETRITLKSRKQQVNVLKDRLAQILVRLGDRCFLDESDEIREEAERQIEDIVRSRNLCDERLRILAELKEHCHKQNHELKIKLDNCKKENQSLDEDLRKTEDKMDAQDAEILNLESQLGLSRADCRDLQNQMSVINSLFSQMLLGASSAEMDLDRLTRLLQENHDLISGMAKENNTEAAALPKLLLDIIEQVDGCARESEVKKEEDDVQEEENIAHNLPKVWRVLLELLSCHAAGKSGANQAPSASAESCPDSCYKSVDTPAGPRLVISVSKTYIRLKELILEKKHLEKEMNRMKQLNSHLENKLSEQEKRLSTVSDELSKTWNVVGRMQAQHQQLHTHEKILRYELQQKRKMLQELKQELEYCREKWESARQKNANTEIEWQSLRREFAARKALVTHADSFSNSGESGFSDEREEESDEDEDEEDVGKRVRPINTRRRLRKGGSRTVTPDTESEQPTDTEFSESKTASSGQRTPTPETEAELENSEVIDEDLTVSTSNNAENSEADSGETLDPFDKALTNVIQNLIRTDESKFNETSSSSENEKIDSIPSSSTKCESVEEKSSVNNEKVSELRIDQSKNLNFEIQQTIKEPKELRWAETNFNSTDSLATTSSVMSIFTIGPIPNQTLSSKNVQFSNPLVIGPSSIFSSENLPNQNLSSSISIKDKNLPQTSESSSEMDNISVDSSSSLETVKNFSTEDKEKNVTLLPEAASSSNAEKITETKTIEDNVESLADARAARLRRLEEQAVLLVKRVSDTNRRGTALNSRLEELHETYGSMPVAPPMPDILPSFRLRTEFNASSVENVETSNNNDDITTHNNDSTP